MEAGEPTENVWGVEGAGPFSDPIEPFPIENTAEYTYYYIIKIRRLIICLFPLIISFSVN